MDSPEEYENLEPTDESSEYSAEVQSRPSRRELQTPESDQPAPERKPRRRRTKADFQDFDLGDASPKPRRTKTESTGAAPSKPKAPSQPKAQAVVTPRKAEPAPKKPKKTPPVVPSIPPTLLSRAQQIYRVVRLIIRLSPVWGLLLLFLLIFGPTFVRSLRPIIIKDAPPISPVFTREVQYWAPQIVRWSQQYNVDPNLTATLMQIESCGYPGAASSAGAQGLFQVMPPNFPDEDQSRMTDPDTNAKWGIKVISDCLGWSEGDVGLAMACYNGGPSLIYRNPIYWPQETKNYYTWGGGIYNDVLRGSTTSQTLNEWLSAGGSGLCQKASVVLGLATPVPGSQPTILPTPLPAIPTFDAGSSNPVQQPDSSGGKLPTFAVPTHTPEVQLFLTPQS